MADTADRPAVRKEGKALIIQLPQRGKKRQQIPPDLVDTLLAALKDLDLGAGEGVAVPQEGDLGEVAVFEKQHQATNYGRKLKDELAAKDPGLGDVSISTPSLEFDADGKAIGPFALALKRKEG